MRFSKHPSDVSCLCYTLHCVLCIYCECCVYIMLCVLLLCMLCIHYVSLQGIRYLIEQNLLNHTAEDIAVFLYEGTELLNKVAIGEYLGSG